MPDRSYSSIYNIKEFWLTEVAPKYFKLEDLNLLQAGLFGYTNEVMANVTEDIVNSNAVLFNEIFPLKANLPETILNYAAQYQVSDINAVPSILPIVVGIKEDSILNNSTVVGENLEFIIDRDSEIVVDGEYTFMLDYDIKITGKLVTDYYIYTAQYMMTNENLLSDITNPYLKTYRMTNNNEKFIFITLYVRQVNKKIISETIYSSDIIDNFSKILTYEDGQLASFNVFYKSPRSHNFIQLQTLLDGSAFIREPFCYYVHSDDNELKLRFPTINGVFYLEFNSEIKYEIFLTKGNEGNISYTGNNIVFIPKSERFDYSDIITICEIIGDATGGHNKKTMDEIKDLIKQESLTLGTITTDIDLNLMLNRLENSKITIFKKRDDFIKRLFEAFVVMIDRETNIIPTNTLNMKLEESDFDIIQDGVRIIKSGSMFKLDGNNTLIKTDSIGIPNVDTYEVSNFLYSNLFTIMIKQNPFFISFYLNSIYRKALLDIYYINSYSYIQFIINNMLIERNAITTNDKNNYIFTLKLSPNTDIPFEIIEKDEDGNFISDLGLLKVFMVIHDQDDIDIGYVKFDILDEKDGIYTLQTKLTTDDYINSYGKIRILNSITLLDGTEPEAEIMVPINNLQISILTFLNTGEPIFDYNDYHNSIEGVSTYKLSNIYKNNDLNRIDLIVDMTNYINSTVKTISTGPNPEDYYFLSKMIPMFRYSYLMESSYMNTILNNNNTILNLIDNAAKLIENNNSIAIKYYNTYGHSKYFTVGLNKEPLNKINLTIKFRIKINRSLLNDNLKNDIIYHIKDYIESINSDRHDIYISNIIHSLKSTFPEIIYVEFTGINNYSTDIQIIENTVSDIKSSLENIKDFVPEFASIDMKKNNNAKEPQILIDYV